MMTVSMELCIIVSIDGLAEVVAYETLAKPIP